RLRVRLDGRLVPDRSIPVNAGARRPPIRQHPSRAQPEAARIARPWGRRRAAVLLGVHVLIALHFVHWKLSGRTLAPLELNEGMQPLGLGVITAGFLLMASVVVSILFVGRVFCSWGCHMLALQDTAAWILGRLRIRTSPLRSRLLPWIAIGTA